LAIHVQQGRWAGEVTRVGAGVVESPMPLMTGRASTGTLVLEAGFGRGVSLNLTAEFTDYRRASSPRWAA